MPSAEHETWIHLFREQPQLAPEILADLLHVALPAYTSIETEDADFTQLIPTQYHADLVILLRDGVPVFGIVLEVQLYKDERKSFSWPLYGVALRARYQCPSCVLVVTPDPAVAEWAAAPIALGAGSTFAPVVLRPQDIPRFHSPAEVAPAPEVAVMASLAHGNTPGGLEVVLATLGFLSGRDDPEARFYYDLIIRSLNEASRQALEGMMRTKDYQYQSEFARKYVAQGEAEALLRVLALKQIEVPDAVRQRVMDCQDRAQLDAWLTRAVTATTLADVFPA